MLSEIELKAIKARIADDKSRLANAASDEARKTIGQRLRYNIQRLHDDRVRRPSWGVWAECL